MAYGFCYNFLKGLEMCGLNTNVSVQLVFHSCKKCALMFFRLYPVIGEVGKVMYCCGVDHWCYSRLCFASVKNCGRKVLGHDET